LAAKPRATISIVEVSSIWSVVAEVVAAAHVSGVASRDRANRLVPIDSRQAAPLAFLIHQLVDARLESDALNRDSVGRDHRRAVLVQASAAGEGESQNEEKYTHEDFERSRPSEIHFSAQALL
jgi:hypothetical protein